MSVTKARKRLAWNIAPQTAAAPQRPGPFDDPGHFEAVPDPAKKADAFVVHQLNWIPDGWSGTTVALVYTDRTTAQALVKRLNGGGR